MNKTKKQIAKAEEKYTKHWQGKGYEIDKRQVSWLALLIKVFGIDEPTNPN